MLGITERREGQQTEKVDFALPQNRSIVDGAMGRHVLYIYADGNDLDDVAARIESDLETELSRRAWSFARPSIVNEHHQPDGTVGPDDSPDWDMGVNLALPDAGAEPPEWFADIEHLVRCFARLTQSTGREFVLGIYDTIQGTSDDLVSIDREDPDIETIRAAIGGTSTVEAR